MWKPKLNPQFLKMLPRVKFSAFFILWNLIFHSLTLAILVYGSMISTQVSSPNRFATLNQFLTENQILFAALCSGSLLLFFRSDLIGILNRRSLPTSEVFRFALRGFGFAGALMFALTLHHDFEFLGLSTQIHLNFLASYAWILRALILLLFIFSNEFLTWIVLLESESANLLNRLFRILTLLSIYWIWFGLSASELFSLLLLSALSLDLLSSLGLMSGFFITTHVIFGLPFFQNEFLGVVQFRSLRAEEGLFQNPLFMLSLVLLLALSTYVRLQMRKESKPHE